MAFMELEECFPVFTFRLPLPRTPLLRGDLLLGVDALAAARPVGVLRHPDERLWPACAPQTRDGIGELLCVLAFALSKYAICILVVYNKCWQN